MVLSSLLTPLLGPQDRIKVFNVTANIPFSPGFIVERTLNALLVSLVNQSMIRAAEAVAGIWIIASSEVRYDTSFISIDDKDCCLGP